MPAYIENEGPDFQGEYLRLRFRFAHENARKYVTKVTKTKAGPNDHRYYTPFRREFINYTDAFDISAEAKYKAAGLETAEEREIHQFCPALPRIPPNTAHRYSISPKPLNDYLYNLGGKLCITLSPSCPALFFYFRDII